MVEHFEDYGRAKEFAYKDAPHPRPWAPFESRLDFEIAELILMAAFNKEQTTTLISLLKHVAEGAEEFTLRSHDDVKKKWEKVSDKCTKVRRFTRVSVFYPESMYFQFQKKTVVAMYKNAERSYDMHFRPLFDWALDQLNHPCLISHFVWDAVRLSKFNGSCWIRFIHEPWTANHWWETQVQHSLYLF